MSHYREILKTLQEDSPTSRSSSPSTRATRSNAKPSSLPLFRSLLSNSSSTTQYNAQHIPPNVPVQSSSFHDFARQQRELQVRITFFWE